MTQSSPARRVLVVDDTVASAKMLSLLVRHLGPYEVEMAHDGTSAIEMAAAFSPDIMMLDLSLPKMDGYEVAQALRLNRGFDAMLLVAVTGHGEEEHRRKSKAAGFDEHVVKPMDLDTLKRMLNHPKFSAPRGESMQ